MWRTLMFGLFAAVLAGGPSSAASPPRCAPWTQRTVASGLGSLENLAFDGRGGLLLSATGKGSVVRIRPGRTGFTTAVRGVVAPGGLRVVGDRLLFVTHDLGASALVNRADGTLERADLRTGRRTVLARGLTMPNGLALLPDGTVVTSRTLGAGTGITRIALRRVPARPQLGWAAVDGTNGLAVEPSGRYLYAALTLTSDARIVRIDLRDPRRVTVAARLSREGRPAKGLDDMTVDADGTLYVVANLSGEVLRFDPRTRTACTLATMLDHPSSLRFGAGKGWHADRLYVTSFDGTVRELRPPG